ncbi:hypothetical protein HNR31_001934 [Anoxybacillus caldiproteolyticus]|uniref:Uncharacterized protein n=1 Tax=Thermaerobacillus caldiproteolyticus TaxID=247480 RepID=A0A7V9Z6Z3_9BACL|nr:hypothetical protein [Anoxybacillus caldiproteolyticus]
MIVKTYCIGLGRKYASVFRFILRTELFMKKWFDLHIEVGSLLFDVKFRHDLHD